MTAKEILAKVKAVFTETLPVEAAPVIEPKGYKLSNGTEVMITQAGEIPAVGDTVTVGGVAAPTGEHELEDKSILVVGDAGVITEIKPAAPITTDLGSDPVVNTPPAAAPIVPAQMASEKTPEEILAMCGAFATGTPEERLTNLEVVAKALMENTFGWQIREAQQKAAADQAIAIYKQDLITTQAAMAKQKESINGLFELCEKLVEVPTTDPKTLTGNKKDRFERTAKKEDRLQGIADAIKEMKNKKIIH